MYEVEMKFHVDDPERLEKRLSEFGIELRPEIEEQDRFYRHPARDFARTDECLRIRRAILPDGAQRNYLTYKGPKIDAETKTRREIDIPLDRSEPWEDVFAALGFECLDFVQKFRRRGSLNFQGRDFDILLDRLPDLATETDRGVFVELETLADPENWENARNSLLDLAARLGLSGSIRTSYLGLLSGRREPD